MYDDLCTISSFNLTQVIQIVFITVVVVVVFVIALNFCSLIDTSFVLTPVYQSNTNHDTFLSFIGNLFFLY